MNVFHDFPALQDAPAFAAPAPLRFSLAVETATHRAWPCLEQLRLGPWTLRFAEGYTKRSNSAWALDAASVASPAPLLETIPEVEAAYGERRQPPIFKLPDFLPPEVDAELARRGYQRLDPTLVLARPLDDRAPGTESGFLRLDGAGDWHARWCGCGNRHDDVHARLLLRVAPGARFVCVGPAREQGFDSLGAEAPAACCGLGVPDPRLPLFGIFDVCTSPKERRRGRATALINGLLADAAESGATWAYLQVVEANAPARALYAGLGFREIHRYWYRVRT